MDMGLSEIQQMLKNSAREFLAQESPLTLAREMENDAQGFPDDLWRQVASLGWTGIPFPEQYGGTGGSFLDLAVLIEEMGRALLPAPYFATVVLGGLTVLDAGSDDQKGYLLPGVCTGDVRLTLALTEPSATTEAWGIETTAAPSADGYILNGVKLFVPDAHAADIIIVAARTAEPAGDNPEDGVTLLFVPSDAPGVTVAQIATIGNERLCEVQLDGVAVPQEAALGAVGRGWPVIERALARATAAHCVQMVGGAEAVLDMTLDYVKQRTQFGRPVGSFQAVKHHLAEARLQIHFAAPAVAYAAHALAGHLEDASRSASTAKWLAGRAAAVAGRAALQCHGAIGYTVEADLHLFLKRSWALARTWGDDDHHADRVAAALGL